jgi:hypothetical protein
MTRRCRECCGRLEGGGGIVAGMDYEVLEVYDCGMLRVMAADGRPFIALEADFEPLDLDPESVQALRGVGRQAAE